MPIQTLPAFYATALIAVMAAIAAPASAETPECPHQTLSDPVASQDSTYPAQTSEGEITFEVRPRWEDGALFVEVTGVTHSVPLESLDLTAQVRLIIGADSFAPDEAGELSGHHGSTTLEFRLETRPAEFSIEIRDVPDVPLRTLTWPAGGMAEPGSADPPLSPELDGR